MCKSPKVKYCVINSSSCTLINFLSWYINMFADDINLYHGISNPSDSQRFCSQMWTYFAGGLSSGSSSLISENAKVMHCRSSNPKTKYCKNGKQLQMTDTEHDLGETIK